MRAERYNTAERYPRIFAPISSFATGVSRGWFSEDRDQPITPEAMTTARAPIYWATILMRVEGGDSLNEARRGRRGFDSELTRVLRDGMGW
jgi:hypothetical protein